VVVLTALIDEEDEEVVEPLRRPLSRRRGTETSAGGGEAQGYVLAPAFRRSRSRGGSAFSTKSIVGFSLGVACAGLLFLVSVLVLGGKP
jgi:hypothetical protein